MALLWYFVPRLRDRSSKVNSEARSALMGRIVDSYTNILTVKLFARQRHQDDYVRDANDRQTGLSQAAQRVMTVFGTLLNTLNAGLIAGACALALALWQHGSIQVGAIAMVLPLTFQLANMSRQIAIRISDIFEDVGVVQEGMMTIAQPLRSHPMAPRRAGARVVREGRIAFEDVRFGYGRETGGARKFHAHGAGGREDRPGRPLGRRQVHRGQSAAAFLRSRAGPHPDRRAGHLERATQE